MKNRQKHKIKNFIDTINLQSVFNNIKKYVDEFDIIKTFTWRRWEDIEIEWNYEKIDYWLLQMIVPNKKHIMRISVQKWLDQNDVIGQFIEQTQEYYEDYIYNNRDSY